MACLTENKSFLLFGYKFYTHIDTTCLRNFLREYVQYDYSRPSGNKLDALKEIFIEREDSTCRLIDSGCVSIFYIPRKIEYPPCFAVKYVYKILKQVKSLKKTNKLTFNKPKTIKYLRPILPNSEHVKVSN